MAKGRITYEEVAIAADTLVAENRNPTIISIRERMGNTGSSTTILKHMQTWRDSNPIVTATSAILPDSVTVPLATAIEQAKAQGRAESGELLLQARVEIEELAVYRGTVETLAEQVSDLTAEKEMLLAKSEEQVKEITELTQLNQREQYSAEQARIETASTRIEIKMLAQKLEEISAESERLRALVETHLQARQQAEKDSAVHAARLDELRINATKSETRLEQVEQKYQQAMNELKELQDEYHAVQAKRIRPSVGWRRSVGSCQSRRRKITALIVESDPR